MKKLFCLFVILLMAHLLVARVPDTLSVHSLEFIRNDGQWPGQVLYTARLHGATLFAESNCLTVEVVSPVQLQQFYENKFSGKPQRPLDAAAYKMHFVGCRSEATVMPADPFPHYYNFFLGKDSRSWRGRVPAFHSIHYHDLYPGIDLSVSQSESSLKYEYVLQPYTDPSLISISYEGVQSLKISDGYLLVNTAVSRVLELPPVAYQLSDGGDTLFVSCRYVLAKNKLSFSLGEYDPSRTLVIDPVVVFSSYSGATSDNWGYTATFDSGGNLYGGGICFGPYYPLTTGAYQIDYAGGRTDISISKFNAAGNNLVYSTFLGGSKTDIPHSLYVNDNDELYVMGTTGSSDFPVTSNAFDPTFNGGMSYTLSTSLAFNNGSDMMVSKFSAGGDQLLASTYVGGSENDGINISPILRKNYADDNRGEILIDDNSNVYVVSSTFSPDFPVTVGTYDSTANGAQDVCVFKMSQDLSQMIWSTYLGGSRADAGYSMALASDGSVFVCGGTRSLDFPATSQAFQDTLTGDASGFVAHLSENGRMLLQSSYLGFSDYDQCYLVKVDRQDHPHLFGQTNATGNAWIYNANYSVSGGGQFLTKLSSALDTLVWSTAFGSGNGGPDISPTALMVDYCNNIYLSGWGSHSLNGFGGTNGLPVTADAFQSTTDGSDFYFMAIHDDASNLVYATYFGGATSQARGTSRFDKHGRIYQAVCAGCHSIGNVSSFPTTPGAYATQNGSDNCNLGAIKIDFNMPVVVADFLMPNVICLPDSVFFSNYSQLISNQTSILWDFGDGTTSTEWEPYHIYLSTGYYEVTLIVHDLGSCNVSDTLKKRILVLANTSSTLPTVDICQGDFAELGIPPSIGVDYLWSPESSLSNPHLSNPIATPDGTTTYTLIASTSACVDTITQEVVVHTLEVSPLDASGVISDTTICFGDTAILRLEISASDTYQIDWSEAPDFQTIIATDSTKLHVSPTYSQNYYARVRTEFCTKVIPFHVSIDNPAIINARSYLICFEDYIELNVSGVNGIPPYQFFWQLDDGETSSDVNPQVAPPHTTHYHVTLTDALGCTATADGLITVREGTFPEPLEAWCSSCDIVAYHETTLNSTDYGNDYTYQWTPAESLANPTLPSTTATLETTTTYTVSVTDTFGCTCTATVTVMVTPVVCDNPFVFIPNSFTPNGDGVNDLLYVRSDILDECYFVIYDRWGEKLFETSDQNIGWDGKYKQKECQRGTYDYYFKGKCKDGDTLELKGNVTLIR